MRITENGLISVTKNLTYLADFIISYTTIPDMVINISKLTFELTNLKFTICPIPLDFLTPVLKADSTTLLKTLFPCNVPINFISTDIFFSPFNLMPLNNIF